jgi:hypothetical protein
MYDSGKALKTPKVVTACVTPDVAVKLDYGNPVLLALPTLFAPLCPV